MKNSLTDVVSNIAKNILLFLFPVALGLNLINYYFLDSVFALFLFSNIVCWLKNRDPQTIAHFRIKTFPVNIFFAIFFLSGIVGYMLHSPMQQKQWGEILNLRWIFGLYGACFMGLLFRPNFRLSYIFVPTLLVLLWLSWSHLKQNHGSFFGMKIRFAGMYENTNHFALAVVLLWAYLLGLTVMQKKNWKPRLINILTLLLAFITILATYSRSSWLAILAAFTVAIIYSREKWLLRIGGFAAVILGIGISLNFFGIKERLIYSMDTSSLNSQVSRLTVWQVAGNIFLDHPFFGVGFEENVRKYPEYYNKLGFGTELVVGHAHNQYLEVLSGAGIFGLIGYVGSFALAAIYFHRRFKNADSIEDRQVSLGALLLIVALTFSSFTDATFRLHEARNYVLILLGFSYGFLNSKKTYKENAAQ